MSHSYYPFSFPFIIHSPSFLFLFLSFLLLLRYFLYSCLISISILSSWSLFPSLSFSPFHQPFNFLSLSFIQLYLHSVLPLPYTIPFFPPFNILSSCSYLLSFNLHSISLFLFLYLFLLHSLTPVSPLYYVICCTISSTPTLSLSFSFSFLFYVHFPSTPSLHPFHSSLSLTSSPVPFLHP